MSNQEKRNPSPMAERLKGDLDLIRIMRSPLAKLWNLTLVELNIKLMQWDILLNNYVQKCSVLVPDESAASIKGNMGKTLAKEEVTWDVFCKGLSVLHKRPRFFIDLKYKSKVSHTYVDVPFTCNEKRGDLLATAWKEIQREWPDKTSNLKQHLREYSARVKKLGRDKKSTLPSTLPQALKKDAITFNVLKQTLDALDFEELVIGLEFPDGRFITLKEK